MKHVVKVICFIAACAAVGIFLYSRRHVEYSLEIRPAAENVENDASAEKAAVVSEDIVFPAHFEKEVGELLSFDTEIIVDPSFEAEGFQEATATRITMDAELLSDYFMGENNGLPATVYENYRDPEEYDTPLTVYEHQGKYLSIAAHDFTYFLSPQTDYVNNAFYPYRSVDEYNGHLYSKESNLDFMDRKSAWNEVMAIMDAVGINMSAAVAQAVYSLDMETMQKEETCIDINGKETAAGKNPEWSKSDEGYYYYLTQSYQGIPFYPTRRVEEDDDCNASLTIFQQESSLALVNLTRWFELTPGKERFAYLPFEDIMLTIEEKYSGTLHTNPLTVERAKLYLFPFQAEGETYTLVPVWVCRIAENHVDWGEDAYISYIYIPINAVTGEEMFALES